MNNYTELHAYSNYSFLRGASHIEELVITAREQGYDTLALTDYNGLYGALEFAHCARENGLRPITGADVTTAGGYQLTLLCETRQGYANLCRLLSHAHLDHERRKPSVEYEVLSRHTAGLIALSGSKHGEVPSLVAEGRYREAEETARKYGQWFGENSFFIELQNNLVYGDGQRNQALFDLAEHVGIEVIATNNVHYHARERHRLQDILTAIRHNTTLNASHLRLENSEYYLKPQQEMTGLVRNFPKALSNTMRIAERCQFDLSRDLDYQFPDAPVPVGETSESYLRKLCHCEAGRKYGRLSQKVIDRLEEELRLVELHHLSGFFLIHYEIMQLAHEIATEVKGRPPHGPPGRGRGSSVSAIICYLIGLSHIDPIRSDLFLGRFLNDELMSVPDIDLYFDRETREKLIVRVLDHYGREHASIVGAFPTYEIQGAVRDVGGALGLPEPMLDRLAKASEGGSTEHIVGEVAHIPGYGDKLGASLWRHFIDMVQQINAFPKHLAQHSGGIVISSTPLVEIVPLQLSPIDGRTIMHWDKLSVGVGAHGQD